jgi:hypothetical protein
MKVCHVRQRVLRCMPSQFIPTVGEVNRLLRRSDAPFTSVRRTMSAAPRMIFGDVISSGSVSVETTGMSSALKLAGPCRDPRRFLEPVSQLLGGPTLSAVRHRRLTRST